MKVLLGVLAAILFAGAITYSLLNWITPFSKLRVKEEAAANAPVMAGDSPSSSGAVAPAQSPAAFNVVSTAIQGAVGKVKSWFGQVAPPPKPQVARVSRPQQKVAAGSPTAGSPRDGNVVTITRDMSLHIQYGIVGLRRGTRVVLISRDGANVHVRDATGEILVIPVSATDLR